MGKVLTFGDGFFGNEGADMGQDALAIVKILEILQFSIIVILDFGNVTVAISQTGSLVIVHTDDFSDQFTVIGHRVYVLAQNNLSNLILVV